ncbi:MULTISPECIES: alpha/beta hydrolase [Pseudofrankia]|uniref:alpha/beta hydrolase n=1 Tax=Pseudofrankia TaxID=2994363 RepID=UPI000234D6CD|nr:MULTISPECIES: alpha/beta hydrolase [Pseudofrankia]OHV29121.1 alpha/beta hydrolase [Pseudofrankia sp. EUN1h]
MSQQQRDAVDALLRNAPYDQTASIEQQRDAFEQRQAQPPPGDVTARDSTLGGRPALVLDVAGADSRDGRAGADGGTVLLYLHGGGYAIGSARTGARLAVLLARRAGTKAVSLDYRLAPEHPFPAAVDDALAAYRELLDSGIGPDRVAVAGDSAGGGLAVAALVAVRDAGLPQPAAAVVLSPWTDLTLAGASLRTKQGIDPLFTRERLGTLADWYLAGHDPSDPLASPVLADLSGLPPLLAQVGSHEILLDDAVRLAGQAGAHDVDVTLEVWPGVPHVFQNFTGALDEADEALDRAGRFLSRHLATSPVS